MQRKQLIIVGIALALLLLGGGTALILRPWEGGGPEVSPRPPGPNNTEAGAVKAEPGDTAVMLSWEPIEGAQGYFVYRDGGKDPLNPTPVTQARYEDLGLSNGRTYSYEVASTDAAGVPGKRSTKVTVAPRAR